MKKREILDGFLFLLAVAICLVAGNLQGKASVKPETVEVLKVIERHHTDKEYIEVEKPVIVENIIIREVEKPICIPQPLRHFNTVAELEKWLAQDKTNCIVFEKDSEGYLVDITPTGYDCEDYAYALQANALMDGFILSVEIVRDKSHAMNTALIGNEIYLIEPQTDKVTLYTPID